MVIKGGLQSLNNFGGMQYDRGLNKEEADKIRRLKLQIKYLETENDFLAKLRAKRAEANSGRARKLHSRNNCNSSFHKEYF